MDSFMDIKTFYSFYVNFILFLKLILLEYSWCTIDFCCIAKWTVTHTPICMCVCVCVCVYVYIHIHFFRESIHIQVITKYWAVSPVLYGRFLLLTCFVYINPNLPINLSPLSPLGLPGRSSGKSICLPVQEMQENVGLISGLRRSPGVGNSNLPLYSFPGTFHGQWSLVGYSPWGHKKWTPMSMHTHTHIISPW